MASLVEIIHDRLAADATLVGVLGVNGYSGILQGGVWTRPLKREGAGKTPEAFYVSEKGRMLRPAAVIVDRGEVEHPQRDAIPTAYDSFPLIYFYAPATATGKTAIRLASKRVFDLLDDWTFATENGPIAFVTYVDRVGILDSEEFIGTVYDYCRYRITSRVTNKV